MLYYFVPSILRLVLSAEISSGEIREIPKLYSCYKISIKDLYEEDYIESDANNGKIINPLNDVDLTKISNCNVHVYKKNNRVYAYFGDKSCQLGF